MDVSNTPFLYTWPGFVTEEIWPIEVNGRAVAAVESDISRSHQDPHPEQISCFGLDGLLRRHDFTIDVNAGAPAMLYATDYRDVDGIIIPTTRRAWLDDEHQVPAVAIDMGEITVR